MKERGMPRRRNYPRSIPRVGKCTYCGGVVYANQAVGVPDPTVTVWDYRKADYVPKKWLCHRLSSGYFCEEYVRERLNKGKVEGHE